MAEPVVRPARNGVGVFFHSVTFRLLLYLLPVIGVVTVAFSLVNFQTTRQQLTQLAENSALRTSELIKRATHYGMLLNRKDDVHHTIRQLSRSPGVAGIRVYDKQGTIIFSANGAEIGRKVGQQAEACIDCHASGLAAPVEEPRSRFRQFRSPDGERILGLINPIRNEPSCSNAACHAHRSDQRVLGVLDVQMSMTFMEHAIVSTRSQLAWATLAMLLIVTLGTIVFIHRVVRRPVNRICEGTQRVAAGDFGTRIEVETDDEIGHLAAAFNRMTGDLQVARTELTAWSGELEKRVAEKTEELGRVQRQVAHVEKMTSLGKLAASVAHELNNPLAGILNYAKLIERQLGEEPIAESSRAELGRYLEAVQKESLRCGSIVRNLLSFARQGGVEPAPAHLNEIVRRSLMLIEHHLKLNEIRLETEPIEGDDELVCDAGQVQQALVALMINAIEAMSDARGGTLSVRLRRAGEPFEVLIGDTGVGIPMEIRAHIFEPFFSTKGKEGGVGLGLAVVYGITRNHGYTIELDSEPGVGTTFRLLLGRLPKPPPNGVPGQLPE
ncbi:MAG: HAMP domain-containing protein [Candidatus Wallbacteria bacterium]|nr:HAMP domain-containing protein [Candidatus Wallbacteria bacterium]